MTDVATTKPSLFTATDHRSLVEAMAHHFNSVMTPEQINTYVAKLSVIPYQHVGKAAVELLDMCKWMPTIAEWVPEARRWWREDAERKEAAEQKRQIAHKENPLKPGEMQQILQEEAAKGNAWAQELLDNMGGFGKRPPPPVIDWESVNAELDQALEERLASLSPEQRTEREKFLAVLHRPAQGNAKYPLRLCGACGLTLKLLDVGYTGPAPEVQGDVILCKDCSPSYSWARRQ